MHKKVTFLLAGILCTLPAFSQQTFNVQKLDSLVNAIQSANRSMFSLAISERGNIVYQRSVGYLDSNLTLASNQDTRYRIGSITKMFTSVMILQLVEEKKLTLQTHLSEFYPKVKNADKITIEQMLSHQTGIHDFTTDKAFLDYYTRKKSHTQMLNRIQNSPSDFEPGSRHEYSNSNYVLLGYIIEKITHKTYAENLKQRIVQPLGLIHTSYGTAANPRNNEARSFAWSKHTWNVQPEADMSIPHAAGAIISTPSDLVKFIHALFAGKLISKNSLDEMLKERKECGLGVFPLPFEEKTTYGHSGGIDEFVSQLTYVPVDSVAIALTTNGSRYSIGQLFLGILNCYYNRPYQIPVFTEYKVPVNILATYQGVYHCAMIDMDITVKPLDGTVEIEMTGQSPAELEPVSDTVFKFTDAGAVFTFVPDEKGQVNEVHLEQSMYNFTFTRKQ